MKRMYVTLSILLLIAFWAGSLLGQQNSKPVDDNISTSMEKRMKMREEMHRRIMDKLIHGIGPDQDMFADMEKMMDEVMTDSFNGFDSLTPTNQNYQSEWQESSGGRTLVITPKSKEQKLNIDISNGLVIIKGMNETKTPHGVSVSNFTNSFSIPADCDGTKVKMDQKDSKILVFFPYLKAPKEIKAPDRKPLPPSGEEVEI